MTGAFWKNIRGPTLDDSIERFEELSSSDTLNNKQQKELERLTKHLQNRYQRLSMCRVHEPGSGLFSKGTSYDKHAKTETQDPNVVQYLRLQVVLDKYGLLPPRSRDDMIKTEYL